MIPTLEIREFLHQYQQKLKPTFAPEEIGLDREIKLQGESTIVIINLSSPNAGSSG